MLSWFLLGEWVALIMYALNFIYPLPEILQFLCFDMVQLLMGFRDILEAQNDSNAYALYLISIQSILDILNDKFWDFHSPAKVFLVHWW